MYVLTFSTPTDDIPFYADKSKQKCMQHVNYLVESGNLHTLFDACCILSERNTHSILEHVILWGLQEHSDTYEVLWDAELVNSVELGVV